MHTNAYSWHENLFCGCFNWMIIALQCYGTTYVQHAVQQHGSAMGIRITSLS